MMADREASPPPMAADDTQPSGLPTISDVAEVARVSIATVSKILNGKYQHASDKKERVLEAVRRLGYQPNRAAAHLGARTAESRRRRNQIPIAFVYRGERPGNRHGPDDEALFAACERLGYHLEMVNLHGQKSERAIFKQLYARGVEGILLGPMYPLDREFDFDPSPFSVVGIGSTPVVTQFHHVTFNPFQQLCLLWEHAYRQGYRRIGSAVMRHPEELRDDWTRLAAAEMMQKRFLTPENQIPPYTGLIRAGCEEFAAWYHAFRPDAIIAFNISIYYFLRDQIGLRIPQDVGFALLHGRQQLSDITGITAIDVRYPFIGPHALALLDQLIRNGERGRPEMPRAVMLTSRIIEGATLRSS